MRDTELIHEWLTDDIALTFRASSPLACIQTPYQQIEVRDTPAFGRVFRLDGCLMSSEADEFFYHENLIHPAAVSHPNPRKALVIGGGDGGSVRQLLKYPGIERIVLAEIDGVVIDVALQHFAAIHHGALHDPRVDIQIGDGLAYLANSQEQFDLIVLDLTDPQGCALPLYQPAFYASCHQHLSPNGLLCLHIGSPQFHPQRFQASIAVLAQQFSLVRPYLVPIALYGGLWGMLIASRGPDPRALSPEAVEAILQERGICGLDYYNGDTHRAVFALPNWVQRLLPA